MILKVFVLYDAKVCAYMPPFFMHSRGHALRALSDLVLDKSTNIGKYPSDFTLFELGEFNDANCTFDFLSTPHSLGVATEFLAVEDRG